MLPSPRWLEGPTSQQGTPLRTFLLFLSVILQAQPRNFGGTLILTLPGMTAVQDYAETANGLDKLRAMLFNRDYLTNNALSAEAADRIIAAGGDPKNPDYEAMQAQVSIELPTWRDSGLLLAQFPERPGIAKQS
jgi:hypothetical protein